MKKILRFDSVGGASGDMVLGALLELCEQQGLDPRLVSQQLARLIPEPFFLKREPKASHGVSGTMLTVELSEEKLENDSNAGGEEKTDSQGEVPKGQGTCENLQDEPSDERTDVPLSMAPLTSTDVPTSTDVSPSATPKIRRFRSVVIRQGDPRGLHNDHADHHDHGDYDHDHGHFHHGDHDHGHPHEHGYHGHGHSHHIHRSYADIRELILHSDLTLRAKELSLAAFQLLAEAEGHVHGMPVEEVHFHEVGATDSIIDTVGACIALDLLGIDGVSLSPIPVGSGTVVCAHGTYPVPAPAVVEILKRHPFPTTLDGEACEMLTPTGATLLATWKKVAIPAGAKLVTVVHSFGHREMASRPNLLRVSLYEVETPTEETTETEAKGNTAEQAGTTGFSAECHAEKSATAVRIPAKYHTEELVQFDTNIDDMTGEQLAAAMGVLFTVGALDVWFTPITMKKSRPAILLSVLCRSENRELVLETLFRHTRTFGVREARVWRHSLQRRWETVETDFGSIRVKIGSFGEGKPVEDLHFSPEFEDCRVAAEKHGVSTGTVMEQARCAMERMRNSHETDH